MPKINRAQGHGSGVRNAVIARLPVVAALLVLLSSLAIGLHRYHHLPQAWAALGMPALSPDFADTRTITHSIDLVSSGGNPYADVSFDPWHRLYNYPPVWLELRHFGIRSATTEWLAGFFTATFFCSCFLLFRARNWITAGIIFLALLSWPVLFALERGNCDLLIFAILTAGALWTGLGGKPVSTLKQTVLIVVLTILKIYPVVLVLAMLRNRKMIWKASAAALLAVLALVASSGSNLTAALRNTPKETYLSFGSFPLVKQLGAPHRWPVAVSLAVIGLLIGVLRRDPITRGFPRIDLYSGRGFLAAAGLTIYGFAFFWGSSFDYRLIFLLCPLMYIVEDLNEKITTIPLLAALILLLFLFCARVSARGPKEFLDALVFLGACAWMSDTLCRNLAIFPMRHPANDLAVQP